MDRTRLAVVGVGHLGKEHARILAGMPSVALVGVVDPRAEQAETVALRCNSQPHTDHTALLEKVDAAVIAVPTQHHHAVACDFLRRGVPLLIEKPITTTLSQADELLRLARQHGTFIQVGHIERFNPAFEELAQRPLRPKLIHGQRLAPFSGRSVDVGVVLDLMIHDIDMALSLACAPVREVEALGVSVLGGQEDLAQARLTFANGCVAHLSVSRVHTAPVRRMEVWSAEGFASADFHRKKLTLVQPSSKLRQLQQQRRAPDAALLGALRAELSSQYLQTCEIECSAEGPDQLTRELGDFLSAVRTGSKVRVTGEQGREALAVATLVLASIHRHAWEGEVAGPVGPFQLPEPAGILFPAGEERAAA